MSRPVLDATALLGFLQMEPGAAIVKDALDNVGCEISAVNYAEVLTKLSDAGVPRQQAIALLSSISLEVVPFEITQAQSVAAMRAFSRPAGLSLADRACLALGEVLNAEVFTADRAWLDLPVSVPIRLIR